MNDKTAPVAMTDEQIRFRFFKDLNAEQRLAVFKAFGVYPDNCTESLNHGIEYRLLKRILNRAALSGASPADQQKPVATQPLVVDGVTIQTFEDWWAMNERFIDPTEPMALCESVWNDSRACIASQADIQPAAWIGVNDRLPEPETDVVVRLKPRRKNMKPKHVVAYYGRPDPSDKHGKPEWFEPLSDEEVEPTHWMPLDPDAAPVAQSQHSEIAAQQAVTPNEIQQIIGEIREQAHEYRQEDSTVGMFADPETANMLDDWADRLAAAPSQQVKEAALPAPRNLSVRIGVTGVEKDGAIVPSAVPIPQQEPKPVQMILHCPKCHLQHIDAPDERTPDWKNEPHRSHLCHGCGHIWRPADVATEGVAVIKTKGSNDSSPQEQHKPYVLKTPTPEMIEAGSRAMWAEAAIQDGDTAADSWWENPNGHVMQEETRIKTRGQVLAAWKAMTSATPRHDSLELTEDFINKLIQRICELPDRSSPNDDPEAMVCTPEELRDSIRVTEEEFNELGRAIYTAAIDAAIAATQKEKP